MPPPPCNEQNPATLTRYDSARQCFEAAAPVQGVCLSNLELKDVGGLAEAECAFDSQGNVYARLGLEGEWLTGEGWSFVNLEPYGPWPLDEYPTPAQQGTCSRLAACAPDCTTGKLLYAGGLPPGACAAYEDAGSADAGDAAATACVARTPPDDLGEYRASALPSGACDGAATCEIAAVAAGCCGEAPYNAYTCTCTAGSWSCAVRIQGAAVCTPGCDDNGDPLDGGDGG